MSATLPSPACLALVKRFEGFLSQPLALGGDLWLVGFNHVRRGAPGGAIDETEAEYLLKEDLEEVAQIVRGASFVNLSQSQFDALVSFGFSVGLEAFAVSDVLQLVNAGRAMEAAAALEGWTHSNAAGETMEHLVRRRAAEKALFLTEDLTKPAASAVLRPARAEPPPPSKPAAPRESVDPVAMAALGALGLLLIAMGVTGADKDSGLSYLIFAGPGAVAVAMSVYYLLKRVAAA